MPDSNLEIVRQVYAAWARGESPGPRELLDDDIEYVNPSGALEPGTRRGIEEFTRATERTLDSFGAWTAEILDSRASGDDIAVRTRYTVRGQGSGIEVEGVESALWTVRDGRVTRYEWFHGPDDAFAALESR